MIIIIIVIWSKFKNKFWTHRTNSHSTEMLTICDGIKHKPVLKPRVSPAFAITYFNNHCNISPTPMVTHERMWIKVNDPKMTFDPTSVEVTCVTLSKDHFIQVPWKYVKLCGYSDLFFPKTWTKGHWPLDDFWPQVCWGHMCDSTQQSHMFPYTHHHGTRIIVSKSHENTSKYVDTVTLFFKNLNQRSLTPRWPLTSHLSRSHVRLYPRIIVSKSHGNTSLYVDTVINFAKYHIHTTCILRTYTRYYIQNEWSHTVNFFLTAQVPLNETFGRELATWLRPL